MIEPKTTYPNGSPVPLPSKSLHRAELQVLYARCDVPDVFRDGSSANLRRIYDDIVWIYDKLDSLRNELEELGL